MPEITPPRGPACHVAKALADSSPGAALIARLALSKRMAQILASAPELSACGFDFDRPGVCELRDLQLRLSARSPSESTKLRQSQPAIQAVLASHGFEGIQIRLSVQPVRPIYRLPGSSEYSHKPGTEVVDATHHAALDYRSMASFAKKLANTIENPLIRASAERMYRAAQARLAGTRDENRVFP
jgi:hypothetical protein